MSPAVLNTCNTAPDTGDQGFFLIQASFSLSSDGYGIISQLSKDALSLKGLPLLCCEPEIRDPQELCVFTGVGLAPTLHFLTNKHGLSVVPPHGTP